jgi:hypothetical protein
VDGSQTFTNEVRLTVLDRGTSTFIVVWDRSVLRTRGDERFILDREICGTANRFSRGGVVMRELLGNLTKGLGNWRLEFRNGLLLRVLDGENKPERCLDWHCDIIICCCCCIWI